MRFTEADSDQGHRIDAYGAEGILVAGRIHRSALLVASRELVSPWGPAKPGELDSEHFEPILALEPDLVLLGTGLGQQFPAPEIFALLARRNVALEVMDTGGACRTYNILISEGRRVVAALFPL